MQSYKIHFTDKNFLLSFFSALGLLTISLVVQYYASFYVTRSVSEPVTDIILSNTRVWDVGDIFVYGALLLTGIGVVAGLRRPYSMPFVMKSIALFTLIRSFFVSLTHISPFPTRALIDSTFFNHSWFSGIFTGNDLFFSGHTGVPFLLALIFWEYKTLRYIFLSFSIVFAFVVLLGHLHYSIDVASAYFITYSIFHLCQVLFKKDWGLFLKK
ncbi:MAG: phosphatase PAP2-related protein [Candidatus Paceibacterota bacterium]